MGASPRFVEQAGPVLLSYVSISAPAAITSKNRTVNGVPTSLAQLGYSDVGLDD